MKAVFINPGWLSHLLKSGVLSKQSKSVLSRLSSSKSNYDDFHDSQEDYEDDTPRYNKNTSSRQTNYDNYDEGRPKHHGRNFDDSWAKPRSNFGRNRFHDDDSFQNDDDYDSNEQRHGGYNKFNDRSSHGGRSNYGDSNDRSSYGGRSNYGDSNDRSSYGGRSNYGDSNFRSNDRMSDVGDKLTKIDWKGINLDPINKDFYTSSEVILNRSTEEVEQFRKKHNMSITGDNIPRPVENFSDITFPHHIENAISKMGFESPMPIQCQSWPIALSGRDLIGVGQTGSGKTLAYILPAIMHISNQTQEVQKNGPVALVMAPTRELVQQIMDVSIQATYNSNVMTACAYGGAGKQPQMQQLMRRPQICVATPGRLLDFLEMGVINLRRCSYLVLDEADRMLDMGFEVQIRKIIGQIRPDRQTLMWSATWPEDVRSLSQDYLTNDHALLSVGSSDLVANPDIEQLVEVCNPYERPQRFIQLLRSEIENDREKKILVFVSMKRTVDDLVCRLQQNRITAAGLHGGYSQTARDESLNRFKAGRVQVLISTNLASRGLDVNDISMVVNYEFPDCIEDYIHRIGRTARAGKKGRSMSYISESEGAIIKELVKVMEKANQEVPEDVRNIVEESNKYGRPSKNKYNAPHGKQRYRSSRVW